MVNYMNASFEHLLSILQQPAAARPSLQAAFDRKRLADFERALRVRPHWLPITHTLPAAAATAPVVAQTDDLNHPVIVHGAITDGEDRNCKFYKDLEARAIVRYGPGAATRLSLDAIAGHSVATAGYPGVRNFPEPFLIETSKSLTLEIYQETSPGATETVATAFCGTRPYQAGRDDATLSGAARAEVMKWISRRPAPETSYMVVPVTMSAAGAGGTADVETPRTPEPMFIRGFRSTFTNATVNLGFDSDSSFSKSKFPIWALCAEPDNGQKLFEMLRVPLPLLPNQQLLFSLVNTIDGVTFSGNGDIEIMLSTV